MKLLEIFVIDSHTRVNNCTSTHWKHMWRYQREKKRQLFTFNSAEFLLFPHRVVQSVFFIVIVDRVNPTSEKVTITIIIIIIRIPPD